MYMVKTAAILGMVALVAGCAMPATDAERAVGGAIAGGLIASATDNNVLTGAAIGGAAGAFCDNLNVPGCVSR